MLSSIILSLLSLAVSTSAHMKLNEPKSWETNNSPLDPSGSDFPCKNVDFNGPSEMNTYAQGQSAPLSFIGQAVHGGGSCQISLTTDKSPTKASVWRVVKSFIGGCPAVDEAGNMGGDANALDPYTYGFAIPDDVPAGEYTLAWTWFNRLGNREMYMQCAPATITGGSGDDSTFNALPEMFKANIPGIGADGCGTAHGVDVEFPDPGAYVERFGSFETNAPTGSCPASSSGGGGGGQAQTNDPVVEPETDALPGGVFVDVTTPAATAPTATPKNNDDANSAPETVPTPAVALPIPDDDDVAAAPTGGDAGSFAAGTACTEDGAWNCIAGSSFQRCASGAWSTAINLASGTSCTAGISQEIAISRRGHHLKAKRFSAKMRI